MFENRTEAGKKLGNLLKEEGIDADIVLAVPRGGLPVGSEVADVLGAELGVVVAKKMGAPGNSELAVGAVSSDSSVVLNEDIIEMWDVPESHVEAERERMAEQAGEKLSKYGGMKDVSGRSVVVVDDGVATGATIKACLKMVRKQGPERIILAVPVAPAETLSELEGFVDEMYVLEIPDNFMSVGQFYHHFNQVTDQEAKKYLRER